MQKTKQDKVKAEPNRAKLNSNQAAIQKKYVVDSGWSESSNLGTSHQGSKNSNKSAISRNYLKTRDFLHIDGLQFTQRGQPIYHVVFGVKGKQMKETIKCSKEQMEAVQEYLMRSVSFQFLKQLLKSTRNQEVENEKLMSEKIDREDIQEISS